MRFADWLVMMLIRTDMGVIGFCVNILVHSQIYISLLALQWCAHTVGDLSAQIQKLREMQAGTYTGFELIAPTLTMIQEPGRNYFTRTTTSDNE